jgi:hypothetical protein
VKTVHITDCLLHGRENAIPARRLADLLELKNTRDLRYLVDTERVNGAVILACDAGYYLPDENGDLSDVKCFIARMDSRVRSNLAYTASAKAYLREHTENFDEQQEGI